MEDGRGEERKRVALKRKQAYELGTTNDAAVVKPGLLPLDRQVRAL